MAFIAFFARLCLDGLEPTMIDALLEDSNEYLGVLNAEGDVVDAARFCSLARKYAIEADDILSYDGCGFQQALEFKKRWLDAMAEW